MPSLINSHIPFLPKHAQTSSAHLVHSPAFPPWTSCYQSGTGGGALQEGRLTTTGVIKIGLTQIHALWVRTHAHVNYARVIPLLPK